MFNLQVYSETYLAWTFNNHHYLYLLKEGIFVFYLFMEPMKFHE